MKQVRVKKSRSPRERRWDEALPADPRDPDILRAKELARSGKPGQRTTGHAVTVDGSAKSGDA
jgi:hypothetical protein